MTSSQERPVLGGLYHDYACVEGRKMKRRSPTLIKSPLTWPTTDAPVVPPAIPVLAAGRHATDDPTCNALDRHPRTESLRLFAVRGLVLRVSRKRYWKSAIIPLEDYQS